MTEGYTIIDCLLHKGTASVRTSTAAPRTDGLLLFLKTYHRIQIVDIFNDVDLKRKAKVEMSIVNGPLLLALW